MGFWKEKVPGQKMFCFVGSDSKESVVHGTGFDPCGEYALRRKWLPTLAFLPGEFHEKRRLVGYSVWVLKELDT